MSEATRFEISLSERSGPSRMRCRQGRAALMLRSAAMIALRSETRVVLSMRSVHCALRSSKSTPPFAPDWPASPGRPLPTTPLFVRVWPAHAPGPASPDRSPNPRLHRRTLNLAAFSGFRRGLRGSVPRRQHFGDPRTASRENKTESSAGGLPSARVSGTAPPRLVLPAPGGCDAAGSAVTASAPPQPVAARAPRARRDPGADGPRTATAGPGAR